MARPKKKQKQTVETKAAPDTVSFEISTPDTDFNSAVKPMNFQKRAGLATYAEELKERLSDIDDVADNVYFMLPVKLPKKVYQRLLTKALEMTDVSPDWTERDQLEALVLFSGSVK